MRVALVEFEEWGVNFRRSGVAGGRCGGKGDGGEGGGGVLDDLAGGEGIGIFAGSLSGCGFGDGGTGG